MTPAIDDLVKLRSDCLEAWISPAHGAAIACLFERNRGFQLLRETPAEAIAAGDTMKFGCFPLVPYSNRVGFRRLSVNGRVLELPPNREGAAHSFHGNAWMQSWTIERQSEAMLELSLVNESGNPNWPYAYTALQRFELNGNVLQLTLSLRNSGAETFPAGLGWHPFFRTSSGSRIAFSAQGVWLNDADMLPQQLVETSGAWNFAGGRGLRGIGVDNCFTGWNRHARLEQPDAAYALVIEASETLSSLVVFRPIDGREFIAIEPVTHVNNGANLLAQGRQDTGIRMLTPGAELTGTMTIALELL